MKKVVIIGSDPLGSIGYLKMAECQTEIAFIGKVAPVSVESIMEQKPDLVAFDGAIDAHREELPGLVRELKNSHPEVILVAIHDEEPSPEWQQAVEPKTVADLVAAGVDTPSSRSKAAATIEYMLHLEERILAQFGGDQAALEEMIVALIAAGEAENRYDAMMLVGDEGATGESIDNSMPTLKLNPDGSKPKQD